MGADGESNLNRILFGKLEDFKIDKVDTASLDKLVENIVMANVEETMTEDVDMEGDLESVEETLDIEMEETEEELTDVAEELDGDDQDHQRASNGEHS